MANSALGLHRLPKTMMATPIPVVARALAAAPPASGFTLFSITAFRTRRRQNQDTG